MQLGWSGAHTTIRPFDILDFVLGWTTLDLMGDDERNLELRANAHETQ